MPERDYLWVLEEGNILERLCDAALLSGYCQKG